MRDFSELNTSLAEKIRTLFGEQGIMIASILTAIGMAIEVLVEALLPGAAATSGGEPPPKDEAGLKKWIRNKLWHQILIRSKYWHRY